MERDATAIAAHYASPSLAQRIQEAVAHSGRRIESYEDTAALDEFHMRGRIATRELAALAQLKQGRTLLDLGCGLGGPGRVLAAEFGCSVTGIDLMAEYIEAARMLSEMVGLSDRTDYRQGNMLAMPFTDNSFDVVWSQHTFMNIEDKATLFHEIHRVLRPGGCLALYEIMAGEIQPLHYPVQWAGDASISFLLPGEEFKDEIGKAGFTISHWQDVSEECNRWFQAVIAKMKQRPKDSPPPLALNLVIGQSTAEKAANTAKNLFENRIRVIYGLIRKS